MNEDINNVDPRQMLKADLRRAIKDSLNEDTYLGLSGLAELIFEALGPESSSILARFIELEKQKTQSQ